VRDCPARAIEIEIEDRATRKSVFHYHIDRCIYCAQCVESCKEGALTMSSTLYHLASTQKADFTEVYTAKGTGVCREEDEGK
jgi:formate hydrogenlyase subunit 6/NADH:ubiquinone oxidoreductase subunit I